MVDSLNLTDPRVLRASPELLDAPRPPAGVTTLPSLFHHQACIHPENIAFSCQTPHEGHRAVNFAEADGIASQVAAKLHTLTGGRDSHDQAPAIAVWLEKGLDLNLSILASTYSGATWLPFDPDVPEERAATCCESAAARVLLTDDEHLERARRVAALVNKCSASPLQVKTFAQLVAESSSPAELARKSSIHLEARPQDAAYLIYTSGESLSIVSALGTVN